MSKTILNYLLERKNRCATHLAAQYKENGRWVKYRWQEYVSLVESLCASFSHLNVIEGDRIAIIANTRLEWPITDFAIMAAGCVTVPIYPNNLAADVEFILNNSEVKILILEDHLQYKKWKSIEKACPHVQKVIIMDKKQITSSEVIFWNELIQTGREILSTQNNFFEHAIKKIDLKTTASILYTSGTTGNPKGVVLSHEQIMSELEDVFGIVTVTHDDLSLTFLPYSHILGRVEAWGSVYAGYALAFAENIDRIKQNLIEVKPTFLIAVPRIFEKIYAGILAQSETSRTKYKLFKYFLSIGKTISEARQQKKDLGLALTLQKELAHQLAFKKVHTAMGGRLRFAVSGGAPLGPDVARFFHGMDILICEGYGLTETTAAVTFNTPLHYKFGTVGRPIGDVKIKIAADGEICVQSKKVMLSYYKDPQATAEVLEDGYFKTGDIGHLDEDGYLVITDRKKDLIKTAGGKYVAPQKLENLLKRNPYISNVLIHGDQKKYIVSLITLNAKNVEDFASRKSISYRSYVDLAQHPEIYSLIKDAVAEANVELASFESIKKFSILNTDFTVEAGELTPSLKVKRRFCDKKFSEQIAELYS